VLGLSNVMPDWLAALIVGAVVSIIGFVLINSGKNKLDPAVLKPERTQHALQKDKEMVERRIQ
jgi:Putative Actinobacterial Holin-X, holin superfamily III